MPGSDPFARRSGAMRRTTRPDAATKTRTPYSPHSALRRWRSGPSKLRAPGTEGAWRAGRYTSTGRPPSRSRRRRSAPPGVSPTPAHLLIEAASRSGDEEKGGVGDGRLLGERGARHHADVSRARVLDQHGPSEEAAVPEACGDVPERRADLEEHHQVGELERLRDLPGAVERGQDRQALVPCGERGLEVGRRRLDGGDPGDDDDRDFRGAGTDSPEEVGKGAVEERVSEGDESDALASLEVREDLLPRPLPLPPAQGEDRCGRPHVALGHTVGRAGTPVASRRAREDARGREDPHGLDGHELGVARPDAHAVEGAPRAHLPIPRTIVTGPRGRRRRGPPDPALRDRWTSRK